MNIKRWAAPLMVLIILISITAPAFAYDNPFRIRVRASYPLGMRTVEQGANYLLDTIDYRLILHPPAPAEARRIAGMSIGPLARTGGIVPLEEALLLLVGENNQVVVDHEHKLVTFEQIPGGAQ